MENLECGGASSEFEISDPGFQAESGFKACGWLPGCKWQNSTDPKKNKKEVNFMKKTRLKIPTSLEFISKRMEQIRVERGLNQLDIKRLCIEKKIPYILSPNAICMIENGIRLPTMQALNSFINATGITFSEFFKGA